MMDDGGDDCSIDVTELERILRATEPGAFLVPPRILRRVIKSDLGLARVGVHIPHRRLYVSTGGSLRGVVSEEELGLDKSGAGWPSIAILLERPTTEDLASSTREAILGDYWRLLFHAQVHVGMERSLARERTFDNAIRKRIERIGNIEFDEIRTVLRQEGLLLALADDRSVLIEFGAYYLELRRFAPGLLAHTFPAIEDPTSVDSLLAELVDDEVLYQATKLEGAVAPLIETIPGSVEGENEEDAEGEFESEPRDDWPIERATGASKRLLDRADAIAARGNLVRAAILRTEAARRTTAELAESVRAGARSELDRLIRRLQRALAFDDSEAERWRRALPALLDRSARGFWTPEARLLYDLQKVCVDHEREVFTTDLVGWIVSWGRRPIRRVQPYLREVMTANHLRSASKRLASTRLRGEDRTRLATLLHASVKRGELVLRDRLRGPIDATLTTTGFKPRNLPERVAYRKLIEELLDRIASRGFLSLGDLRDACSRSNLKMPDLASPREFLEGDRLLKADEALSKSLDGVYRQGEIYLRSLQRFSSLAFATSIGRFLTSYVALPYGGAFLMLEGLQHIIGPLVHWLGGGHIHIMNLPSLLVLGTVALGVLDFPNFRQGFLMAVRVVGRGLRMVCFDSLAWVLRQPLLRFLFVGRFASLVWRLLLKPAMVTVLVWGVAKSLGLGQQSVFLLSAIVFVCANLVINSRLGRNVEEIVADEVVRTWKQLYRDIVPGIYRLIVGTFDRVLETVDRLLYAVDEWLRFRSGQNKAMLATKAVLGAGWFFVAYLVRIYVNVLIEPQVNPIKHFPVVTVSHKIILPLSLTLTKLLAAPLMPLGKVVANFIAGSTVLLLPGVFGFLVWELKENWRLYRANRRETLGPIAVGSHGETIGRLLRPGFHSGTLPKLFTKLRKGERRWLREGREKGIIKQNEALHHVEEAIRHFIEREFLALLRESRTLGSMEIEVSALALSTNRITFELSLHQENADVIRIEFVEQSGSLIAEVAEPGWLANLSEVRRQTLTTAIVGLYKLSGIDRIRVHPGDPPARPPHPRDRDGDYSVLIPFQRITVSWKSWVEAWEKKLSTTAFDPTFTEGLGILPPTTQGRKRTSRSISRRTENEPR
ncbi:hypothetical protein [Singulisphaera acidiphila]|uniref:Uncharacterized protein n=1 Tax=Singulisphaera acidiphila (strain ATCC BAA-1392 / DSM 18658 / VKM B-2454 / MOB10) TaxID=886293 RepID=L0DBC1_SINAD|nr:hypothetical protein [Singulisphaera acidiphila]AGA26542.1 hypothetical protein Sinac_2224 [Singulisphaera acidiphila DSM 18658]